MVQLTPTMILIMVLVFVAGWLLGLASHPGGRRWRERYTAERDAHAAYRRDADARIADAQRAADARVAEADRRHAELRADHDGLASAAPVTAATVAPPRATVAARPAYPAGERRGWFDFGPRRPL